MSSATLRSPPRRATSATSKIRADSIAGKGLLGRGGFFPELGERGGLSLGLRLDGDQPRVGECGERLGVFVQRHAASREQVGRRPGPTDQEAEKRLAAL